MADFNTLNIDLETEPYVNPLGLLRFMKNNINAFSFDLPERNYYNFLSGVRKQEYKYLFTLGVTGQQIIINNPDFSWDGQTNIAVYVVDHALNNCGEWVVSDIEPLGSPRLEVIPRLRGLTDFISETDRHYPAFRVAIVYPDVDPLEIVYISQPVEFIEVDNRINVNWFRFSSESNMFGYTWEDWVNVAPISIYMKASLVGHAPRETSQSYQRITDGVLERYAGNNARTSSFLTPPFSWHDHIAFTRLLSSSFITQGRSTYNHEFDYDAGYESNLQENNYLSRGSFNLVINRGTFYV